MRTTLVLDDDVVREAKRRAAELGVTLSEFVSSAVREVLRVRAPEQEPHFRMITYGGASPTSHHEPGALKAALEREEAERMGLE